MRGLASITVALVACSAGPRAAIEHEQAPPAGRECETAGPPDDATQLLRWARLGQQRRALNEAMKRSLATERNCAELDQELTSELAPHAAELDELDTVGAETNGRFERWADDRFSDVLGHEPYAAALRCQMFRGSTVNRWLTILIVEHGCTVFE